MSDSANAPELVDLPAVPQLRQLYGQAVARQGLLVVRRPATNLTLSPVQYRVRGARLDPQRGAAYQSLLGLAVSDLASPGYVHIAAFPVALALLNRDDSPLPLIGLVHIHNAITVHRALPSNAEIDIVAKLQNLASSASGTQVEVAVQVRLAQDHQLAWEGVSTYLAKGARREGLPQPNTPAREQFQPPRTTASLAFTRTQVNEYLRLSGDANPIHSNSLAAKLFGFKSVIAHGMYSAARVIAAAGPRLEQPLRWEVTFASPVYVPSTASAHYSGEPAYSLWNPESGKPHLYGTLEL